MFNYKNSIEAPLSPLKPLKQSKISFDEGIYEHYLQEIKKFPILSASEEFILAKKFKEEGDTKAAHKLVNSHLRFVVKIAMGYRGYELPVTDLISEGSIGIIQAIKNFEPDQGYRISTLAKFYIKGQILDYVIRNKFPLRIPATLENKKLIFQRNKIKKFLNIKDNITHEDDMLEVGKCANSSSNNTKNILNLIQQHHNSLNDDSLDDDSNTDAENEVFLHNKSENIENKLIDNNLQNYRKKIINNAFKELSKINPRQKDIIISRQFKKISLDSLAQKYKLTNVRISQIEKQARNNLKKIFLKNNIKPINLF